MAEPVLFPRFDGTAMWRSLSRDAQELIGSVALELVAAQRCQERAGEDGNVFPERAQQLARAGQAAEQLLIDLLRQNFVEHIDEATLDDSTGFPALPTMLGPICRACGCSELDACQPFSCSWAEPDLCSACISTAEGSTHG